MICGFGNSIDNLHYIPIACYVPRLENSSNFNS